ncbi:PREDICTED: uncharacterized protein LOC104761864 [Camelina sativa]|uniref:Uncharacterized protein LOC104761864 n=1 Tax=Camelina sativa TaxID=90675 RepID=A0ABM0XB31_CAMSA|nr:PREDICTED: uncharacterized protein LOC104761864 [Camelina sativa]XP_010483314.1 PREDICTED: uncharacterized protein LOC104761864 [Camelina sativa]XP_010483315.1 PREDICTED: uncharacterized protein LOC104761864 [Camelina sativa]XP_010483316.1 PREDICTED: uncharacterized protein LOC104761864 [Camelina sativa]
MKRVSLVARKKHKRKKNIRFVKSIVAYLKSDDYMFAPLFSNSPPFTTEVNTPPSSSSKTDDISLTGFESLGFERVIKKKKRTMSEKVKRYLKSDCHMYGPVISPPKLGSASLKGKLQITNLVTMEVSTSNTTTREDNSNYRNLRSDIVGQALHNGRINFPKRGLVSLEGQRGGLSRETDLSSAFSSLPEEKMVKPDQRRVTIE